MDSENTKTFLAAVVLVVFIVTTIFLQRYISSKFNQNKTNKTKAASKKVEKFCGACQGIGSKVCTNRKLLHELYEKGELTEFTDFASYPPRWKEMVFDRFNEYKTGTKKSC